MKKNYLQPEAEIVKIGGNENILDDAGLAETTTISGGKIGDSDDAGEDLIRQMLPDNDASNALGKIFEFGVFE